MRKGIKYFKAENKWLWYNHIDMNDNARFVEVQQYNRKGVLIEETSIILPPKKYRVKHSEEGVK